MERGEITTGAVREEQWLDCSELRTRDGVKFGIDQRTAALVNQKKGNIDI